MIVSLSIDGRPPIEVELQEPAKNDAAWIAGPIPLAAVDVNRDWHGVVIEGGERDGWEAVAGHGISRGEPTVHLFGKGPFEAPEDDDPIRSAVQVVKDSTEGR